MVFTEVCEVMLLKPLVKIKGTIILLNVKKRVHGIFCNFLKSMHVLSNSQGKLCLVQLEACPSEKMKLHDAQVSSPGQFIFREMFG